MPRTLTAAFGSRDPGRLGLFWGSLLNRRVVTDPDGVVLVPDPVTQLPLRFVPSPLAKTGPNRMHLHVTSSDLDDQRRIAERACTLGGSMIDFGQRPEEGHLVLVDPEGNEFCVIEPGNRFLAGCGDLGELACDGSHRVGVFWSAALGWPLVWDHHEETAIQLPDGGTKVSWGGESVTGEVPSRLFFVLATDDDLTAEVERLVGLGATPLATRPALAEMTDPDGYPFLLRRVGH